MDAKTVQFQLKNSKIRQGSLFKRSKYLKQWRQRWIVLTLNYIFTFSNKECKQLTDYISLKQLRAFKSYLKKQQDNVPPAGWKLQSNQNQIYLCGKNCFQKWSWIVTIQRLMDYKCLGSTTYNNLQFVRTKGFPSQQEYLNGGKVGGRLTELMLNSKKNQVKKNPLEAKQNVDNQIAKIMKELQAQKQKLKLKQDQFFRKQKTLRQQIQQLQKKEKQLNDYPDRTQSRVLILESSEKQSALNNQQRQKSPGKSTVNTLPTKSKVAELKYQLEQKALQEAKQIQPSYKLGYNQASKQKKIQKNQQLYALRTKTISNLFQEFYQTNTQIQELKYVCDFLVKISSNQTFGYRPSIIAELKTHKNRIFLGQVFIDLLTDYHDYQSCASIAKFIQLTLFNVPGLFKLPQIKLIQDKLLDFFLTVDDDERIETILKDIFIINNIKKYDKNEVVKNKLKKMVQSSQRQENKNWARKLVDQF